MANITAFKRNGKLEHHSGLLSTIAVTIDTTSTNVGASDTVDIADLPIGNIRPIMFMVSVTTADGETATADFGLKPTTGSAFTADPNGLNDAVDLDSAVVSAGAIGTDAQMGQLLTATDGATLYMTADHALEDAIFEVVLVYAHED